MVLPGRRPLVVALAAVLLLAATSCGDDDDDAASSSGGSEEDAGGLTSDDLEGRTFTSSEVEGQDLVAGSTIRFTFEDGNLATIAGCNTMTGGYEIEDGRVVVGQLAQTMMACSDELMAQDDWLSALLSGGPTIALEDDTLVLTLDDVTIRATEST